MELLELQAYDVMMEVVHTDLWWCLAVGQGRKGGIAERRYRRGHSKTEKRQKTRSCIYAQGDQEEEEERRRRHAAAQHPHMPIRPSPALADAAMPRTSAASGGLWVGGWE